MDRKSKKELIPKPEGFSEEQLRVIQQAAGMFSISVHYEGARMGTREKSEDFATDRAEAREKGIEIVCYSYKKTEEEIQPAIALFDYMIAVPGDRVR